MMWPFKKKVGVIEAYVRDMNALSSLKRHRGYPKAPKCPPAPDRPITYHCKADSNELINVTELKHLGMLRQGVKRLNDEECKKIRDNINKMITGCNVHNWWRR